MSLLLSVDLKNGQLLHPEVLKLVNSFEALSEKEKHDLTSFKSGIYGILNIKNYKMYVGSTKGIKSRWAHHTSILLSNKHHSSKLQKAWNKYGQESFVFFILEHCNEIDLIKKEQFYLDSLNPNYNILKIAGSSVGRKISKEHRDLLSKLKKGVPLSEKHRENMMNALRYRRKGGRIGFSPSEETRQKQRDKITGRKYTMEHRSKISASNMGRKVSKEQTERIRQLNLGKKLSADQKMAISLANKGKFVSELTKLRRGASMRFRYAVKNNPNHNQYFLI